MVIGIDARLLGKGFGIGRYVEQLIENLQKIDAENQYVLFVKEINNEIKDSRFRQVLADVPWYSWQEQLQMPKIIKKEKIDLMHFPHWNVPFFYKGNFIVTIHDLIMFHFPRPEATTLGPLKFWLKDMAHRLVVKNAVKKAKHIITTSEFTKIDVHNTLKVPLEKMTTVYQAPFISPGNEEDRQGILEKFGIKKPYVLYVGSAYPHKNLDGLLKAWELFLNKFNLDYRLVLVGKENYFYRKIKESEIAKKLGDRVVFTGFVPDSELDVIYKESELYIYPSLYEGFGLPPLEAMTRGVPVASSNSSCLPEVLGEAAIYFDPNDIENIADTIKKVLLDDNIRHELSVNRVAELKKYSLQKMAEQTLKIYGSNCG